MHAQVTTIEEDRAAKTIMAAALVAAYEAGKEKKFQDIPSEHTLWEKLTAIIGVET